MLPTLLYSFVRTKKIRPIWYNRIFKRKGDLILKNVEGTITTSVYEHLVTREFYRTDGKKLVLLKMLALKDSSITIKLLFKLCEYIASKDSILGGRLAKIYEIYYPKDNPIIDVANSYFY